MTRNRGRGLLGHFGIGVLLAALAGTGLISAAVLAVRALSALPVSSGACPQQRLSPGYTSRVLGALDSPRDVWGNTLLRSPSGPTYAAASRYLEPLMLVGRPAGSGGHALTDSGVYYLAFGEPTGAGGGGPVALHVADGSEIVSGRADGQQLTVSVGSNGRERYGSCLARLAPPALFAGYLPILDTRYTDASGVRYRQESFAARIPQTGSLVSFVRLTADASRAKAAAQLRFTPSVSGLTVTGSQLVHGQRTYMLFSPGGRFDGSSLDYPVDRSAPRTVYVAWLVEPSSGHGVVLHHVSFEQARTSLIGYWQHRLTQAATFVVPEARVVNAERNLLIQNLLMGWRYSVGNDYETFEFPESLDGAAVMGEYGFRQTDQAILQAALSQPLALYPNWEMGDELLSVARYYRLFHDRAYLDRATPILSRYLGVLGRQITASSRGILNVEPYASDLPASSYGLDSQAIVWHGLAAMASVWALGGRPDLARESRSLADRLEIGLRAALRASVRTLADGSIFVPSRLLAGEAPYEKLTDTRAGSYWNLVTPYALSSGLFPAGSREAAGALRYLLTHGGRLLGLVRFNYRPAPDGNAAVRLRGLPGYRTSGSDDVYALDVARFLADNDQPDQLVLSLYGQLAAGMTPDTFVSGEGATIAPVPGELYREMYLPPNSISNDAFLETLRLTLIHETISRHGQPQGLELAYATPRAWLQPGERILVRHAPTSFGPLSYEIDSTQHNIRIRLTVPDRAPLQTLTLRLRLPNRQQIAQVTLDGRPYTHVNRATATIDFSGRTGVLTLVAGRSRPSDAA